MTESAKEKSAFYGWKNVALLFAGIMIIMFMGIWKLSSLNIMVAAGMVFGFCYGCQLIMFPTIIPNYYGADAFAGINGVIGPFLILFAAVVPVGAGYIFEMTGNYDMAFIALGIMLSIGFIVSFLLLPPNEGGRPTHLT